MEDIDFDGEMFITLTDREAAGKVADSLESAFVWGASPQGYNFWADVHAKLLSIATEVGNG